MSTAKKIATFLFICFCISISAQEAEKDYFQQSLNTQETGMYILGGWALSNMVVGSYGWVTGEGENKYFHQMNFFWNTINFSIAGITLYRQKNLPLTKPDTVAILRSGLHSERIFLINAGLDIIYMGTGWYIHSISENNPQRSDMLWGYGKSIMLQGAFLFVFDLVIYGLLRTQRMHFLREVNISYNGRHAGLSYTKKF